MNQNPAGKKIKCGQKPLGTRVMVSNNMTVIPTLKHIDNIEYKGNAVLNANK
tara:strand:- start:762 stop:917 length:156 start_codon:yes stop_codon:yes gene_type:complete